MLPIHLFCRTLHRQINRITLHQGAADVYVSKLTRLQYFIHSHNISTSCSAHAIDKEINTKSFKQRQQEKPKIRSSVFAAGSAKQRALNCNYEEPKSIKQNVNRKSVTLPTEPLGSDGWSQLKEDFNGKDSYKEILFNMMIQNNSHLNIAKSFLSFIAEKEGDIDYRILVKYLVLCVNQNQLAEVCELYDIMKMKFKLLDAGGSSLFIRGLGKTDRWRESMDILETLKKAGSVSDRNYKDCIEIAIEHQDIKLAWTLYDGMLKNNEKALKVATQSLFDAPQEFQDADYRSRLKKILSYFRENQLYPGEALMKSIKSSFESIPNESWEGTLTTISNGGHCQACNEQIESINLTPEEYSILKKAVIDNIIKGEDIFRKTNPQELQKFLQFVNSQPPYDIVVDGLNAAHSIPNNTLSKNLLNVVLFLKSQGKRLLVLGRKHMLFHSMKWQRQHIKLLKEYSDCFFIDNISSDDPYLLYACMNSGNHCSFLTQDLLRDHKACLPDAETQRLFFKWQRGHQLVISNITSENVYLLPLLSYDTVVQSTDTSYHIPYDPEGVERASFEIPKTWLCLKKQQ